LTNSVTARPGHAIEILQGESPKRLLQGAAIGAVAKQFDIASAHNKSLARSPKRQLARTIKMGVSKALFPNRRGSRNIGSATGFGIMIISNCRLFLDIYLSSVDQ